MNREEWANKFRLAHGVPKDVLLTCERGISWGYVFPNLNNFSLMKTLLSNSLGFPIRELRAAIPGSKNVIEVSGVAPTKVNGLKIHINSAPRGDYTQCGRLWIIFSPKGATNDLTDSTKYEVEFESFGGQDLQELVDQPPVNPDRNDVYLTTRTDLVFDSNKWIYTYVKTQFRMNKFSRQGGLDCGIDTSPFTVFVIEPSRELPGSDYAHATNEVIMDRCVFMDSIWGKKTVGVRNQQSGYSTATESLAVEFDAIVFWSVESELLRKYAGDVMTLSKRIYEGDTDPDLRKACIAKIKDNLTAKVWLDLDLDKPFTRAEIQSFGEHTLAAFEKTGHGNKVMYNPSFIEQINYDILWKISAKKLDLKGMIRTIVKSDRTEPIESESTYYTTTDEHKSIVRQIDAMWKERMGKNHKLIFPMKTWRMCVMYESDIEDMKRKQLDALEEKKEEDTAAGYYCDCVNCGAIRVCMGEIDCRQGSYYSSKYCSFLVEKVEGPHLYVSKWGGRLTVRQEPMFGLIKVHVSSVEKYVDIHNARKDNEHLISNKKKIKK